MSKEQEQVQGGQVAKSSVSVKVSALLHKLFGSTPGDGEMQPKEGLCYSICGFGQNIICTIIGSYLTVFMTDAIGFAALPVAFLMLFARIFDALNDPIMGSIVDRTRTKWGKCRPYLKWMAFPIAAMTVICFLPVFPNSTGGFAALSVLYVLWSVIYTVADVPYWGLSTAMSNDTYRRGNLLTIARLFCTLGAGIITVFVPMITEAVTKVDTTFVNATQNLINVIVPDGTLPKERDAFFKTIANVFVAANGNPTDAVIQAKIALEQLGVNLNVSGEVFLAFRDAHIVSMQHDLRWAYFIITLVGTAIATPLFFVGYLNTKERNVTDVAPPSLKHNLKLLFKNKPLMLIVLSGIGGAARMLFTYTGGLYFAKYIMGRESMYALFTMAIVPGGLIASVLVPWFTKKFGKRNTYIWSHIIGGVAMLLAYVVGIVFDHGNYTSIATTVFLFIGLVVAGVPVGFGNILQYAMIGDTVEYLELKTGERAEGICFAMQTLINKIGMAVGAFVGVLAYYMAGVESGNAAAITSSGKDTMWTILMLVAAVSFFLTVIPLFFYKFNEKQQQEAVAEIKRRKEANSELPAEDAEAIADENVEGVGVIATDGEEPVEEPVETEEPSETEETEEPVDTVGSTEETEEVTAEVPSDEVEEAEEPADEPVEEPVEEPVDEPIEGDEPVAVDEPVAGDEPQQSDEVTEVTTEE